MAGYLGSTPVPQATQHRESFTATEGQTSFATAGYTPQFLDVFLNGSHLSPADFVATNSSDVVLVVAASADDICDIVSYTPFEVADATFTGTTTTDVSLTTGVLTANGGAVFNEGSADVDFRVESNANINMLVVDGGGEVTTIGGLAGATSEDAGYFPLQVGNTGSGATILQMLSAADANCTIHMGDSASGAGRYDGYIQYAHNTRAMNIGSGANNTLSMNANGIVTTPRQPSFHARRSGNYTGYAASTSGGNSQQIILYNVADYNTGSGFNTGNGRFTAPVAGVYLFRAECYSSKTAWEQSWFVVNGSRHSGTDSVLPSTGLIIGNSAIIKLAASDYVGFHPYTSDSNQTVTAHVNHTWFKGILLG